ncbi:MAG: hypothetical protein IKS48_10510 [Eubacterium sp.]|nr:hypothetical protein [Eubacterium sp.]
MMTNVVIGGLQEHQIRRTDGICSTIVAGCGTGGGNTPLVVEKEDDLKTDDNLSLNKDHDDG